jgi:hypothetical protein
MYKHSRLLVARGHALGFNLKSVMMLVSHIERYGVILWRIKF